VEKVEAGPKGVVIAFRGNVFANPAGLLSWIASDGEARVRPDQKVVVMRDWETPEKRMRGTKEVLETLVTIAERAKAA
jgi:transcription-repair coupling factor (superfamily II helicase)